MWRSEVTAGIPCVYTRNLKLNLETSLPVTEADKSAQIVRNVQVQAKNKSSESEKELDFDQRQVRERHGEGKGASCWQS